MRFRDRSDAGLCLAVELAPYAQRPDVLVLAIPRGGVVVGYEVARQLGLPLDIFVVRKIGAEHIPELAVGAIASGGTQIIDDTIVRAVGMTSADLEAVIARERVELERREAAYRGSQPPPEIRGKTILLVDDGVATGATIRVAIAALRQLGPAHIVVAVPVVDDSIQPLLAREADSVVAVLKPIRLEAVGEWYDSFEQTSDAEVIDLLHRAAQLSEPHPV